MIFKAQNYKEMMNEYDEFNRKSPEEQLISRIKWACDQISSILNISLEEAEMSIKIFHPMIICENKDVFMPASKALCNWLNSKTIENSEWFLYSCFKYYFLEKWINCQNYQTMTTLAAEMLVYSKDKDQNEQY